MATKRGLANALRAAAAATDAHNRPIEDITVAISALVQANAEAGTVRPDLDPRAVMRGLSGLLLLDPNGDRQANHGGFGIQMFGHVANKRAVHGERHIRSTVDYVREGRKNNFD